MPIREDSVDPDLGERLKADGVPIMGREADERQELGPMYIGLANMMPAQAMENTEVQWSRWFGSEPRLQTGIRLVKFDNDCREGYDEEKKRLRSRTGILQRYSPLSEIKGGDLHALVLTGDNLEVEPSTEGLAARQPKPIELRNIDYRDRLLDLINWSGENVPVTIFSCLAAHFGLHYLHELPKQTKDRKVFGVYEHEVADRKDPLVRGMGDVIIAPHSRWGDTDIELVREKKDLKILAASELVGWLALRETLPNGNLRIYLQGHPEYDCDDLKDEFERDRAAGQDIPVDYFPDNDPDQSPRFTWEPYARLLQQNILGEMYRITEARRNRIQEAQ